MYARAAKQAPAGALPFLRALTIKKRPHRCRERHYRRTGEEAVNLSRFLGGGHRGDDVTVKGIQERKRHAETA